MTSQPAPEEIMNEILEKLKNLGPKELLSYAIFNEEDEAKFYAELAEKVERPSVKALFKKMSEESKVHEMLLRREFKKLFPGEEPVKVEAPPVEVYPFLPKFESAQDYLTALRYCMESELFAKRTYEQLALISENDEVQKLAMELAEIEMGHYEEIKTVYELIEEFERRNLTPEGLSPGAYLLTDEKKGKYFLLDFIDESKKLKLFVRENPLKFRRFLGDNVDIVWITKVRGPNTVTPEELPTMRVDIEDFFVSARSEGKRGALFIQNLGYLLTQMGFQKLMDLVLYIKDVAVLNEGYLIATALPDVFEKREWAIVESEFDVIS